MGRPLTGTRWTEGDRHGFACPESRGSRRRRQATFATADERDAYALAALAALEAGCSLPEPDAFRARTLPATTPRVTSFAGVATSWYDKHHTTVRRSGADRAVSVKRLLDDEVIPFFEPRVRSVEDLTQDLLIEFYDHFRHYGSRTGAASLTWQTGIAQASADHLTVREAATACDVSTSTIKRADARGAFPNAFRDPDRGCRVLPVGDLAAAGFLDAPDAAEPRAVSYARLAVETIKAVCRYARANGLQVPDISDGLRLVDGKPASPQRALTWEECARLAGHLHPIWQIVLWLMRSLGLRISEVFGLLVSDVVDLGDGGLVDVYRQGGRSFHVYAPDGQIERVSDKEVTKTAASIRIIVACEPIMAMLRVVVQAFHTDPVTGAVDGDARLVPGLRNAGAGGQAGFRSAMEAAARAEGLDSSSLDFRVSSHLLRKSLTTELAWNAALQESAKRRYIGQRAADDVFGRTYTLSHPDLDPSRAIALAVQADIDTYLGGSLLVPTARRFTFRTDNPLKARGHHSTAVLTEAGWLATGDDDPAGPLLKACEVAHELQVSERAARRMMTSGEIPSVPLKRPGAPVARHARLLDVSAARERLISQVRLPDLAAELGLGYHETRRMLHRLGRDPARRARTGEYLLDDLDVQAVRREAGRMQALHRRSVRVAHAAVLLNTGVSTVNALLREGGLTLDPETDPSRAKFVTRASVEVEGMRRQRLTERRRRLSVKADDGVSLEEARALTGLSEGMLLGLGRSGHLQRCDGRTRTWAVTPSSLMSWAIGYRPDLLPRLATRCGGSYGAAEEGVGC